MVNIETKDMKLSSGAQILILNQVLSKMISIFLNTFLAAYFYKITQQNIFYLSLYNMIGWFVATIGAFWTADFIKRKNKMNVYRFGTLIQIVYIFIIILMKEKIVNYVWLIGIIYGISVATIGFPFNMIKSEQISNQERSRYLGYEVVATESVSLIVPILLGAYITAYSYEVTAGLILVFAILKLILSFFIQNKNVQTSQINLRKMWQIFVKDENLKKLYLVEFLKGFNRYGVMSLVVSLLMIYQTENDLELGSWTSLFSLFTIISMYLFGKYYHEAQKRKMLEVSAIVTIASFIYIAFSVNLVSVVAYNIAYAVFMNIILNITEKDLFDYANREPFAKELNTEYFVLRELFLNIGRIVGYSILLVAVGITQNLEMLSILFFIIMISVLFTILMSWQMKESD